MMLFVRETGLFFDLCHSQKWQNDSLTVNKKHKLQSKNPTCLLARTSFIFNTSSSCRARYWFSVSRGEASMCRHLCGWDQAVRPLTPTLTVPSAFAAPETTTHLIPGKAWRRNLLLFSSFTPSLSPPLPAVPASRCHSSEAPFLNRFQRQRMRGKCASLWFLGRCINSSVVTAGSSGA